MEKKANWKKMKEGADKKLKADEEEAKLEEVKR